MEKHKIDIEALTQEVKVFLTRVIDLAEKIHNLDLKRQMVDIDPAHSERFYQEMVKVFEASPRMVHLWADRIGLSASTSWQVYQNFLISLEQEHLKEQYRAKNNEKTVIDNAYDNPFLMQIQRENDTDEQVMEQIQKGALTRNEILNLLGKLSLKELNGLLQLAQGLNMGDMWERKYDL